MSLQKYRLKHWKDRDTQSRLTIILFATYLLALLWILLLKFGVKFSYMESRTINLIPFDKPLLLNGKMDLGEMILNVVIFFPLGIYAGILFERRPFVKNILLFFVSALIESIQLILKIGAFDITDIITNTTGGIIGLLIFNVTEVACKSKATAQKSINLVAATCTVIMLILLFLLKMNMLPVRYQ